MSTVGKYLEYCGDIMINLNILSTMTGAQDRGDIMSTVTIY